MEGWQIENAVVYICTSAMVIGLYAMSGSWHSFWALLMLVFVNLRAGKK